MKIHQLALAAALLSVTAMGHATCYTVFKTDGTILLETSTTPVDLTEPIGDTIPMKFGPGASMTISAHNFYCGARPGEVGTANSLAEAVLAEEKKAMLLKGPEVKAESVKAVVAKADAAKAVPVKAEAVKPVAMKEAPATPQVAKEESSKAMVVKEESPKAASLKEDGAKTVMVKEDGSKTVVETQKGTVLKVKPKDKERAKEAL